MNQMKRESDNPTMRSVPMTMPAICPDDGFFDVVYLMNMILVCTNAVVLGEDLDPARCSGFAGYAMDVSKRNRQN